MARMRAALLALCGALLRADTAPRAHEPARWAWVHIPKTSTSIGNTLFYHMCPKIPRTTKIPDVEISEGQDLDAMRGTGQLLLMDRFLDLLDGDQQACVKQHLMPPFADLRHHGISPQSFAKAKGALVGMFRQPEQRILSDLKYFPCGSRGMAQCAWDRHGCQVRYLLGKEAKFCEANRDKSSVSGPQFSPQEVQTAIARLEGFAFVGITDEFDRSICLWHAMFGGQCTASEFAHVRKGPGFSEYGYDTAELHGWTDPVDGPLFDAAKARFDRDVATYGATDAKCRALCPEAADRFESAHALKQAATPAGKRAAHLKALVKAVRPTLLAEAPPQRGLLRLQKDVAKGRQAKDAGTSAVPSARGGGFGGELAAPGPLSMSPLEKAVEGQLAGSKLRRGSMDKCPVAMVDLDPFKIEFGYEVNVAVPHAYFLYRCGKLLSTASCGGAAMHALYWFSPEHKEAKMCQRGGGFKDKARYDGVITMQEVREGYELAQWSPPPHKQHYLRQETPFVFKHPRSIYIINKHHQLNMHYKKQHGNNDPVTFFSPAYLRELLTNIEKHCPDTGVVYYNNFEFTAPEDDLPGSSVVPIENANGESDTDVVKQFAFAQTVEDVYRQYAGDRLESAIPPYALNALQMQAMSHHNCFLGVQGGDQAFAANFGGHHLVLDRKKGQAEPDGFYQGTLPKLAGGSFDRITSYDLYTAAAMRKFFYSGCSLCKVD